MFSAIFQIFIVMTVIFWGYGCCTFLKIVGSGPGGIKHIEKYSFIGVVDFEGEGGKEAAMAIASAMRKMETIIEKKRLQVKYIPALRGSTKSKIKVRTFKRFDDQVRYRKLKEQSFINSKQRFERRATQEAIKQGQRYGVEAIITGKMIFNDVVDLSIERATDTHIMRKAMVKFYTILINARTGQIDGRAYDVWNKGFLFADTHIPRKEIDLLEYGAEQFVEHGVLKSLSTTKMAVGAIYDYLKDGFQPPDLMIKKARERAVNALITGLIMGTNY